MKDRPILFSGEMIRARRSGLKTQTRRTRGLNEVNKNPDNWELTNLRVWPGGDCVTATFRQKDWNRVLCINCPYGQPDDRLWVRENFYVQPGLWREGHGEQPLHYAADVAHRAEVEDYVCKPSIHMPRWASRITLEITEVRVQRLQDITAADAIAEGVEPVAYTKGGSIQYRDHSERTCGFFSPVDSFRTLWDSLNAGRGLGWERNPWVWVIEFPKFENPEDKQ